MCLLLSTKREAGATTSSTSSQRPTVSSDVEHGHDNTPLMLPEIVRNHTIQLAELRDRKARQARVAGANHQLRRIKMQVRTTPEQGTDGRALRAQAARIFGAGGPPRGARAAAGAGKEPDVLLCKARGAVGYRCCRWTSPWWVTCALPFASTVLPIHPTPSCLGPRTASLSAERQPAVDLLELMLRERDRCFLAWNRYRSLHEGQYSTVRDFYPNLSTQDCFIVQSGARRLPLDPDQHLRGVPLGNIQKHWEKLCVMTPALITTQISASCGFGKPEIPVKQLAWILLEWVDGPSDPNRNFAHELASRLHTLESWA